MNTLVGHQRIRLGFTLIELLLVIGLIAILASIVIIAINPEKQLTDANNAKAQQHLNTILKGLDQFYLDFERVPIQSQLPAIIDTDREICQDNLSEVDCSINKYAFLTELTPDYLVDIPIDEQNATERVFGPFTARGTGYWVRIDADGRFHVSSPNRGIEIP